jgi:hypothetical protein
LREVAVGRMSWVYSCEAKKNIFFSLVRLLISFGMMTGPPMLNPEMSTAKKGFSSPSLMRM